MSFEEVALQDAFRGKEIPNILWTCYVVCFSFTLVSYLLQTSLQFIDTINFLELKHTSLPASVAD